MESRYQQFFSRIFYFLKYPFKLWGYELIDQWVMATVPYRPQGKLLIFRLDLVGDYLMCRPFFAGLRDDDRWKGYRFSFAGNLQVRSLAETLDARVFDSFYWIDRRRFINSWGYRFQILRQIRSSGFEVVLYPSHTRQYWLESVVRTCGALRRWTAMPVGCYMNSIEEAASRGHYSGHLPTGGPFLFEFYRNRNFFSHFSESASGVLQLLSKELSGRQTANPVLLVLSPGASTRDREWPLENFISVVIGISTRTPVSVAVMGSPSEKAAGEKIKLALPGIPVEIWAGEYTLMESLIKLQKAHLLISNESGPVHMAATAGTPCVCISQGNHFGRWNPYPPEVAPEIRTVYPDSFGVVRENYAILCRRFHAGSKEKISSVSWMRVLEAAILLLREQGIRL